jgi:cytochrome c peroxidase
MRIVSSLLLVALQACSTPGKSEIFQTAQTTPYVWQVPEGFPLPPEPVDNPTTQEKVTLGRHLFYDTRLSADGSMSCASCHEQDKAFSDGKIRSTGVTGETHPRNSMALVNIAYNTALTWANPDLHALETQMLIPLFGEDPPELGMVGKEQELLTKLAQDPIYQELFSRAFPERPALTLQSLTQALAAFQRTLISANSPYDQATYAHNATAMSPAAQRGEALFFSERLECFHCHGGFNFSDSSRHRRSTQAEALFHNTGLYNLGNTGAYPHPNTGLYELTHRPSDMGKFRAPTLRNIAVTAPYMHDGSIPTLEAVIDHYAAGGRTLTQGEHAGIGSKNPYKNGFVKGFQLSEAEKQDLIAFLESLTDKTFLTNPDHQNPWK